MLSDVVSKLTRLFPSARASRSRRVSLRTRSRRGRRLYMSAMQIHVSAFPCLIPFLVVADFDAIPLLHICVCRRCKLGRWKSSSCPSSFPTLRQRESVARFRYLPTHHIKHPLIPNHIRIRTRPLRNGKDMIIIRTLMHMVMLTWLGNLLTSLLASRLLARVRHFLNATVPAFTLFSRMRGFKWG